MLLKVFHQKGLEQNYATEIFGKITCKSYSGCRKINAPDPIKKLTK